MHPSAHRRFGEIEVARNLANTLAALQDQLHHFGLVLGREHTSWFSHQKHLCRRYYRFISRIHQTGGSPLRTATWYTKAQPTFSDALAAVRARVWQSSTFCRSVAKADRVKIPALLLERLTEALCYAA